jgi:hypothetical protein
MEFLPNSYQKNLQLRGSTLKRGDKGIRAYAWSFGPQIFVLREKPWHCARARCAACCSKFFIGLGIASDLTGSNRP